MTRFSTQQFRTARSTAMADRGEKISTTYHRLRILGFDEREAGNLTAYVNGIAIGPQPWTVRELTNLLFLREMNRAGRRSSNAEDRAAIGDDRRLPIGESKLWDADSSDGRVTLLSHFRGMSGPGANIEHRAPSGYRSSEALRDRDRGGH